VPLGLCDVVARALAANLDIAIAQYTPDIRDAELLSAEGEFDPVIRLDYSYFDQKVAQTSRQGISTGAAKTETKGNDITGTLSGKLISGTEYTLLFDREFSKFTRFGVFNPLTGGFETVPSPGQYFLDTSINVTQPLLKDFGLTTNLAGIRIARVQRDSGLEDFRQNVINIISEAQSAYWGLVLALENLRVNNTALSLARDLLRENRIRQQVGTMSPLEVIEAEAGVARAEEGVIIGQRLVKDAEDNLKRLLNLPRNTVEWDVTIMPTDQPEVVHLKFDVAKEVETALQNRPDYKSSLLQVESSAINEQFNRNQLLPTVDVFGQYDFQSVANEFDTAFDDIESGQSPTWSAGLTAEYPIGNRTAKGNFQTAQLERQQSMLISDNLRLSIILDVRRAIRGIETSLKSLEASQKTTDFARRSLEAEQKKLEVGISTSHDVLQFVEQLVDAQRREAIAKINYRLALVNLAAANGTLLEKNNIVIDERL
jgi:outer membrane protein TolC